MGPCLILEGVEHDVLPLLIGPWVMAMEGVLSEVLPGHGLEHLFLHRQAEKYELSRVFASRSVRYGR